MDEEAAFLSALESDPDDHATRLVYADWLEERGDARGEYLRTSLRLAHGRSWEPLDDSELDHWDGFLALADRMPLRWRRSVGARFAVVFERLAPEPLSQALSPAISRALRAAMGIRMREAEEHSRLLLRDGRFVIQSRLLLEDAELLRRSLDLRLRQAFVSVPGCRISIQPWNPSHDVHLRRGWATSYIARLRRGETVTFPLEDLSMVGRIELGQKCTVAPVDPALLAPGDIVLCVIAKREYLHVLLEILRDRYLIGDNRGRRTGWVRAPGIYGKCIRVE